MNPRSGSLAFLLVLAALILGPALASAEDQDPYMNHLVHIENAANPADNAVYRLLPTLLSDGEVDLMVGDDGLDMLERYGVRYRVVESFPTTPLDRLRADAKTALQNSRAEDRLVAQTLAMGDGAFESHVDLPKAVGDSGFRVIALDPCAELIEGGRIGEIAIKLDSPEPTTFAALLVNNTFVYLPLVRSGVTMSGIWSFPHEFSASDEAPLLLVADDVSNVEVEIATMAQRDCGDIWWAGAPSDIYTFNHYHCLYVWKDTPYDIVSAWVVENDALSDDAVWSGYIYCNEEDGYRGKYCATWTMQLGSQDCDTDIWAYDGGCDRAYATDPHTDPDMQIRDETSPVIPSLSSPSDDYTTTINRITLSCSASNDNSNPPCSDLWYYFRLSGPTSANSGWQQNDRTWYTPSLADGHYQWRARVHDCAGNISSYSTSRDFYIGAPDLVVDGTATPSSAYRGQSGVGLSCRVRNTGTVEAGSSTLFYYLDASPGSTDVELDTDGVSSLSPGDYSNESESVTIPASTFLGTHYISYVADRTGLVAESNEGNNVVSRQIQIYEAPPEPVITTAIVQIESATEFAVLVTARNNGAASADGGITISFPTFTDPGDKSCVVAVGNTSDDAPGFKVYGAGETIHDSSGNPLVAQYLMCEFSDSNWQGKETNMLSVKIDHDANDNYPYSPNERDPYFPVLVRSAMRWERSTDVTYVNTPPGSLYETIVTDQQGWQAYERGVYGTVPNLVRTFQATLADGKVLVRVDCEPSANACRIIREIGSETMTIFEGEFAELDVDSFEDDLAGLTLAEDALITYRIEYSPDGSPWQTLASSTVEIPARVRTTEILSATPNPFNPCIAIKYSIAAGDDARLAVYDINGSLVKNLAAAAGAAGSGTVVWDGTDSSGRSLPSGTYFVRLSSGSHLDMRKVTLLK